MKIIIGHIGLGIWFLILLSVWSCTQKQEIAKDELVIGVSQDYRATDVFSHKGFNCLVFETLVKLDKKGGFAPLLAESWEKSEDGLQYTFHLRKNVTFSDGTPLTAGQVKESMFYKITQKRKRGPGRRKGGPPGKYSTGKRPGANEDDDIDSSYGTFDNRRYHLPTWSSFSSIDVIDDHTLRFNLPQPYTLFLSELATTHSYPVLKLDPTEKVTGYIGTGPYKIQEHVRIQYMILAKNDHYWQGSVGIDKIRLKVIPDAETRAMALEAGEIDLTGYDHFDKIPDQAVLRLKQLPFVSVTTLKCAENPSVSFLTANYKKSFLQNPDIRKAIGLAIQKEQIDKIISETGRAIQGPFPKDHALSVQHPNPLTHDPDAAKALLEQNGWLDTDQDGILEKNGKPCSLTLTFSFFDPQYKILAEIIQAQLKDIGIDIKLNMVELGAHITTMRNGDYDLAFWPVMRYPMFFYTKHPSWLNVYNSTALDDAFTRYLHNTNEDGKVRAIHETQDLIQDSLAFPLFIERFDVVAWNHDNLKLFKPTPLGWDLSMNLWMSRLKD